MWAAIGSFFLNTRLGQSIILGLAIAAAIGGTYWYIDAKADKRGYDRAKAECEAAQSNAKTDTLNKRAEQAEGASKIGTETAAKTTAAIGAIDKQTNDDQEKNHDDYRSQPAPAARCAARPVPASVQARIDAAVERAN